MHLTAQVPQGNHLRGEPAWLQPAAAGGAGVGPEDRGTAGLAEVSRRAGPGCERSGRRQVWLEWGTQDH